MSGGFWIGLLVFAIYKWLGGKERWDVPVADKLMRGFFILIGLGLVGGIVVGFVDWSRSQERGVGVNAGNASDKNGGAPAQSGVGNQAASSATARSTDSPKKNSGEKSVIDLLTAGKWRFANEKTGSVFQFEEGGKVIVEKNNGDISECRWEPMTRNEKKRTLEIKWFGFKDTPASNSWTTWVFGFSADGRTATRTEHFNWKDGKIVNSFGNDGYTRVD